ncbi:MAG: RDD family protein [Candidatus Acidiferrales bacterium]
MFCSKCGAQLMEGTSFCSACGQPASGPPAPAGVQSAYASPAIAPGGGMPVYQSAAMAMPLPSPYAGFWLRVVAHIIDGIVLGVVFGLLFIVGIAIVGVSLRGVFQGMDEPGAGPSAALVLMIIFIVFLGIFASWIYYAYMESSPNQGTLGKMALGLIVTDMQGRRIGFGHASGRFFAKIVTGLIPLGIGYMMAGFTEKKQALHDMIAGCLVLRKN